MAAVEPTATFRRIGLELYCLPQRLVGLNTCAIRFALVLFGTVLAPPAFAESEWRSHVMVECNVSGSRFQSWTRIPILDGTRSIRGLDVYSEKGETAENPFRIAIIDSVGCAVILTGFEFGVESLRGFIQDYSDFGGRETHYLAPVEVILREVNRRALEACGPEPVDEQARINDAQCRNPIFEAIDETGASLVVWWDMSGVQFSAVVVGFEEKLVGLSVWNSETDERSALLLEEVR